MQQIDLIRNRKAILIRTGSLRLIVDPTKLLHAEISASIIAAFYEVYNNLGYGFLEFPYDAAMERELLDRQHQVGREVGVPLYYKAHQLCTYRLDMLVDDKVIIEIKSTAELPKTAIRQLHNYLYATDYEVGLLLHFGPEPKFYRQCVLNKDKKAVPSLIGKIR